MLADSGFDLSVFIDRRKRLIETIGPDSLLILPAAPERQRGRDSFYPYQQDADFRYLCGFPEPHAVLVICPEHSEHPVVLFCQPRDPVRELWEGRRIGQANAVADYGVDAAFAIDALDQMLPDLLQGRTTVYYPMARERDFDHRVIGWLTALRVQRRSVADIPHQIADCAPLLHPMRMRKTPAERAVLRRAAQISMEGQRAAMRCVQAGVAEYALQAEIERVFCQHGASPAYNTIVGAGENACVLHYQTNRSQCQSGDLVLVDAGAQWCGYAGDITRTFPVDGRFSPEQRALYTIVEDMHAAALAQVKPNHPFASIHTAAVTVLTEGLLRLGVITGQLDQAIQAGLYRPYYPHKTSHWLGLDVHDVGEYGSEGQPCLLEEGMVLTIEPGIYIAPDASQVQPRWRGIGIRLEDDVAVTATGHEVLTAPLERSADAIEAYMAEHHSR